MTFDKFVKIMHLVRYNAVDSYAGNAAYSFLAFYMVTYYALQLFRYKSSATQYSLGAAASTNWYEISALTSGYAGFSIWAMLAFMQILASFGLLGAINMMVWYWSAVLGSVSMLAVFVFRIMAYEDGYKFITDSSSSPATITNGELLWQAIKADVSEDATLFSMASLVLCWQYENWKTWQWNSMSPQEQEMMIESAEKQMLEWQDEKLAEMEN